MCGICGKYSPSGVKTEELNSMLDTIVHRGPDDSGCYVNANIGLGSRRLSIIDLETGKQPISNEDGTVWTVLNGEFFDYPELKKSLEAKGHRFKTGYARHGRIETCILIPGTRQPVCCQRYR